MRGEALNSVLSAAEPRRFLVAVYFAFGFAILRFLLDAFVFERLSRRFLRDRAGSTKANATERARGMKFSESLWKLGFYAAAQLWAMAIIDPKKATDIRSYFAGWPNRELRLSVDLFYMWQCGFYLYSVAALLAWETRRKDFSVMMCHHVVTAGLIALSYFARFFEIGCVVLAAHDASDVLLEAAKLLKYSGRETAASVAFAAFSLSWLCLRLLYLPFCVVRATSLQVIEELRGEEGFAPMYYAFNTMLITLLAFHVYWWALICAMIRKQLRNRGHVGHDIRSDDEDEDD